MVAQPHGGALKPGGTPEGRLKGKQVIAERRRARAERDEAIDDGVTGHVEKLSTLVGQLVEEAKGEQYRCSCGLWGPKRPKLALREAADVLRLLMAAVKKPADQATVDPGQRLLPCPTGGGQALVVEHRALTDDELEEHDRLEDCTGIAARWCPIHGDCECEPDEDEDYDTRSSQDCPLHSPTSTHGKANR